MKCFKFNCWLEWSFDGWEVFVLFPTGVFVCICFLSFIIRFHYRFSTCKALLSSVRLVVLVNGMQNDFIFTLGVCPPNEAQRLALFSQECESNRTLTGWASQGWEKGEPERGRHLSLNLGTWKWLSGHNLYLRISQFDLISYTLKGWLNMIYFPWKVTLQNCNWEYINNNADNKG